MIQHEKQEGGAIRFDIVQGERSIATGSLRPRMDA